MQDDFEKELSHRMQEFSISPQPEIWQRVEAALPEKKRRRFALWWWLLPLVAGMGVGMWWLGSDRPAIPSLPVTQQDKKIEKTTAQKIETKEPAPLAVSSTVETKQDTVAASTTATSNTQADGTSAITTSAFTTTENYAQANKHKYTGAMPVIAKKKATTISAISSSAVEKNKFKNDVAAAVDEKKDNLALQAGSGISKPLFAVAKVNSTQVDTTVEQQPGDTAVAKKIATVQPDSAAKKEAAPGQKTTQKKSSKKTTWLADAGFGTSWLQGTSSLDKSLTRSQDNLSFSGPSSGVGSGVSNGSPTVRFIKPSAGFSFSLGAIRRQELNKHVSWQLALHYQFVSATQLTGQRSNIPVSYAIDSVGVKAYKTGSTQGYRNVVHQLQLAPGVVYIINPSTHSPISILAGVSAAYNFSNNVLLHDYANSIYLRSGKALSKMQYGAYLGINIFVQQKIQLGAIYQYSFSNVARASLGSDYRWRRLQFRIALPISK